MQGINPQMSNRIQTDDFYNHRHLSNISLTSAEEYNPQMSNRIQTDDFIIIGICLTSVYHLRKTVSTQFGAIF